jgi:hypothetical protein
MRSLLVVALTGSLVVSACSSGGSESGTDVDSTVPSIVEATPTPVVETDGAEIETTEVPEEEEGVLVNPFDLDPGDCFNTYGVATPDLDVQPTTRVVDCDGPHESEVYYQRNLPGGPEETFPGDDAARRAAEQRCYREFEDFTGTVYELSALEIGVMHPTFDTWTGPGLHREITCYVYAVSGGALQGGSMASSGI